MPARAAAPPRLDGIPFLVAAVLLLGGAWPITRVAVLDGAGTMWFALGRAGLSCLGAFAVLAATGRLRAPGRQDIPAVLAVGLLQLAGFFLFSHAAVAWVPAGRTTVLSNTTTVWIVPLSILLLHEAVSAQRLIAAALGVAGVLVLTGPWTLDWSDHNTVVGHAYLLGASLAWSLAMVLLRLRPPARSMLELLPWCFAVATLAILPFALQHPVGHWSGRGLAGLAFIGLVAGSAGTWCIMQATALLPMVVASIGFLATPALGLLLSVWLLGEPLSPDLAAGTGLILCGVVLASVPIRAFKGWAFRRQVR